MSVNDEPSGHRWRFFRAGGVDQVRIETGADIRALPGLDPKLWVALSCPVHGLDFDERTLVLLDADGDGRIRAPEVVAAAAWTTGLLRNPDVIARGAGAVELAWIDDSGEAGARVLAAARRILAGVGRPGATAITVADALEAAGVLAKAPLNGDGVAPPATLDDPALRAAAEDALACVGGDADRCGDPGVSKAVLERFFAALEAHAAWLAKAEGDAAATVRPLGDATGAAFAAFQAVRAKVDDYFARVRLSAFDARAAAILNRSEDDLKALAARDLVLGAPEIAALPLARVEAGRPLPLATGLNPAWADAVARFRDLALTPLLGAKPALTEGDWAAVAARLAPFEAWQAAKEGATVEALGPARVHDLLASDARAGLAARIDADAALEPEMKAIVDVERLVRYVRDLRSLLDNFVSFADFYSRRTRAVFQAGTLYLDGRACDLCLRVDDPARHATLAGLARAYLAYCDCTRPGGEKMTIVAAVTAGDSDDLMVGRNGVFYDRKGRDWDATITKVVENPISIRQAFFAPYKRFIRLIEDQIAKRAAAADAGGTAQLAAAADQAARADVAQPPAKAPAHKIDIGTVAALGVAVGGITAALGALLQAFFGLGMWMPLGLVGLVLVISVPSVIISWLKLRQRNLGPILDAGGWAVNSRVRINVPFGAALTSVARLPPGSARSLQDPYAEKRSPWPRLAALVLILALAAWGLHRSGLPGRWLAGTEPPADVPAAAAPAK